MKARAHLESLPPYAPIEPFEVLSERIGRDPSQIIKDVPATVELVKLI